MQAQLTPWPNWDQLNDPMPQGDVNNNAANNCGEESVAEVIKYLTGVEVEAGYIKDELYGLQYTGYSGAQKLASYLESKAAIPVEIKQGDASTLLRPVVEACLGAGQPIIVLFFWDLVNLTGGHWCPIVGCDAATVTRSNPWTGTQESFAWASFERIQQLGTALVCGRVRSIVTRKVAA